ncbi:MAG: hypothetical protein EON57_06940 [Alphaproteobacteria bacterium]|nr:MAG: hypothetical protein EON57_06940 [Alphaproteobacteria bacterium]
MRKLKPTPRAAAQFSLTHIVLDGGAQTTAEAVDLLVNQLLRVSLSPQAREALISTLDEELGTAQLAQAESYMEHGLRVVAHLIMSSPQFQLA